MKDLMSNEFDVGDRVVVAFSYSRASVGYMRIGVVEEIDDRDARYEGDIKMRVRWDEDDKLSPRMKYGEASRWLKI